MTEPTELLPCPFCGGINIIHCSHHMYCHACGADGPDADSQHESEAIAVWNTRTPQPTQAQAGAVPLTKAQRERLFQNRRLASEKNMGVKLTAAEWHRIVRYIETAHGIKGGQHGTE